MEDNVAEQREEEYTIIDDEEPVRMTVPPAYLILIRRSALNTKRYMELLEAYKAKRNGGDLQ